MLTAKYRGLFQCRHITHHVAATVHCKPVFSVFQKHQIIQLVEPLRTHTTRFLFVSGSSWPRFRFRFRFEFGSIPISSFHTWLNKA